MPLISVLRNNVRQSAAPQYERLIRFIAERARQDNDTFELGWPSLDRSRGPGDQLRDHCGRASRSWPRASSRMP